MSSLISSLFYSFIHSFLHLLNAYHLLCIRSYSKHFSSINSLLTLILFGAALQFRIFNLNFSLVSLTGIVLIWCSSEQEDYHLGRDSRNSFIIINILFKGIDLAAMVLFCSPLDLLYFFIFLPIMYLRCPEVQQPCWRHKDKSHVLEMVYDEGMRDLSPRWQC